MQLALLVALHHSKPPIMSDYVFPEDQQMAPFEYGWDLDFPFDQFIDPALLAPQAQAANQNPGPVATDMRPSELANMGE